MEIRRSFNGDSLIAMEKEEEEREGVIWEKNSKNSVAKWVKCYSLNSFIVLS